MRRACACTDQKSKIYLSCSLDSFVMELRQLQYLVAVVDEASFTKAAARVHVAQPGVSAQVRRLERELGQSLLDRSGGTVRLTEVGAAIMPYARAALSATAALRQTVDALAGLVRGHLTVGTVASISTPHLDLPGVLAGFHQNHPGIDITLNEAGSDQLVAALRTGRLDVAFIGLEATPLPENVSVQVVATEPLAVAVDRRHPLASKKIVTLEALQDHALISLPRGTGVRSLIEDACAASGFHPHIAFEAGDPHLLAQLAGKGLGAAILPRSTAIAHSDALHVLRLTRPQLQGRIALAWRTDQPASPATRSFLAHTQRSLVPTGEP